MLEAGRGMLFPVIFYDGERESGMGNIRIHPKQVYKTFQSNISRRVRIPPNQISIFLVDNRDRRMNPISAKSSFAQICRQRDSFVLALLKRRKPIPGVIIVPHNVALLHHHRFLPYPVSQQCCNLHPLLHPNSHVGFPGVEPAMIMGNPVPEFCEECAIAEKNDKVAEFHHCVNDVALEEFGSCPFGPIGGPVRQ